MALTMTRTRTQSALNKLVDLVANVNGELGFLEGLLGQEHQEEVKQRLLARRSLLEGQKAALFETIRQFDPGLDPEAIGTLQVWRKAYATLRTGQDTFNHRFLLQVATQEQDKHLDY